MNKVFILMIHSYLVKQYNQLFEDIIHHYHVTQIEIDVIAFLANNPEYNHARDIVNIRGISKGHVSIAIEKLTRKGYLDRQVDPHNRRCNVLIILPKAQPLITDIQKIQKKYKETLYQGFSQEEIKTYQNYLQRMYKNLGGFYE